MTHPEFRNVAIVAHVDHGKTTLVNAMLEPVSYTHLDVHKRQHLELAESELEHLGRFAAPAANEVGFNVDCDVFVCSTALTELPEVYEEIAEARFFPAHSQSAELAPLSRGVVFPQL